MNGMKGGEMKMCPACGGHGELPAEKADEIQEALADGGESESEPQGQSGAGKDSMAEALVAALMAGKSRPGMA